MQMSRVSSYSTVPIIPTPTQKGIQQTQDVLAVKKATLNPVTAPPKNMPTTNRTNNNYNNNRYSERGEIINTTA